MALPGDYPLKLYRGDSYAWQFRVWSDPSRSQPADLTGVLPKAEIRDKSAGTAILELACAVETADDQTVPNVVRVTLAAALWTDWALKAGAWDLQLTYPGGEVVTIVAGAVTVTADITDSTALAAREARR